MIQLTRAQTLALHRIATRPAVVAGTVHHTSRRRLMDLGLVEVDTPGYLRATDEGRRLSDSWPCTCHPQPVKENTRV